MTSWREIPPVVIVAAVGTVLLRAFAIFYGLANDDVGYAWWVKIDLAMEAASFALLGLFAHGAAELAARSTGRTRVGLRVAMFAFLGVMACWVVSLALIAKGMIDSETSVMIESYAYWIVELAAAVGLVVAAGPARGVVLACFAVWLAVDLPPHVAQWLHRALDLGQTASQLKMLLDVTLRLGMVVALFGLVPASEPTPVPSAAIDGFRRAANGLWLRVVAVAVLLCLGLIAMGARSSEGFYKFAFVTGHIINFVGFTMFAYGALEAARSALHEMPRIALALGGAASAWCAGVLVMQAPAVYHRVTGDSGHGDRGETLAALAVTLPLVAMLGGAIVAGAIGSFANRRANLQLASQATSATIAFVLLDLGSLAVLTWLLEKATSAGSSLMMLVMALGALLAAQVVLAKLCGAASAAVDGDTNMPVARIRD